MVEKSKRQKKNFVTEEDISTVLQRYTATTVLALLQEVAQVQDVKIDWNALVKKTTTGISNAREYQMLWRHLAYRDCLIDRLDDAAQPMDDDSDLECELEAFPPVSSEASAEAAACVKVLIASGVSNDPTGSTVEAPLTINIPKGQMSKAPENSQSTNCTIGTNITVPISVQKQPMPGNTNVEGLDSNGAANGNLPRRKRKPWSAAEDLELIAAVQKCGEGNWANILKGDFKGERTASQLSQRWAIIKKRTGNLNVGTGSQISDVHLATRRAVSMALGESPMPSCSIANAGANSNAVHSSLGQPAGTETPGGGTQSLPSFQHDSVTTALGSSGLSKARIVPKKPSAKTSPSLESVVTKSNLNSDSIASKSTLSPDSLVKAAAVAAGARIATPSDAASLLKAAQSKNAVHIMPGGSLIKSSIAGSSSSLPSNVHFIRTGLASRPLSSYSTAATNTSQPGGTNQVLGASTKPAATVIQPNSGGTSSELGIPSDETKSGAISVFSLGHDVKTVEKSSPITATTKELVLEGQADVTSKATSKKVEGEQHTTSGSVPMDVDASGNSSKEVIEGGQTPVLSKSLEQNGGGEVSAAADASKLQDDQINSSGSVLPAGNGHHDITGNDKSTILSAEHNGKIPPAIEETHENVSMSVVKEGPEDVAVDGNKGEQNPSQQTTANEVTV